MTSGNWTDKFFNSKYAGFSALTLLMAVAVVGGGGHLADYRITDNPQTHDAGNTVEGQVPGWITQEVSIYHKRDIDHDGTREVIDTLANDKNNLLVDQGRNFYQAKIAGTSFPAGADLFSNATYIALSNESSPEAADVALQGEFTSGGLGRKNCRAAGGTYIDLGVGNYSCSATFTATSQFNNVNMTGLMWNGTQASSSLVAEVGFKSANLLPDDQIVANWTEISFVEAP